MSVSVLGESVTSLSLFSNSLMKKSYCALKYRVPCSPGPAASGNISCVTCALLRCLGHFFLQSSCLQRLSAYLPIVSSLVPLLWAGVVHLWSEMCTWTKVPQNVWVGSWPGLCWSSRGRAHSTGTKGSMTGKDGFAKTWWRVGRGVGTSKLGCWFPQVAIFYSGGQGRESMPVSSFVPREVSLWSLSPQATLLSWANHSPSRLPPLFFHLLFPHCTCSGCWSCYLF